ncbi:hypothetical protein RUND412_001690 [Rhizina undulata]
MSRKSNQYAITAPSSHSTPPAPHTHSSSSDALSLHNPYSLLQDGIPEKTPQHNHNQTPSSGSESTRGSNKDSGGGKKKLNATDRETDDSDSSIEQDDEDAEDDDDEPAVHGSVRVNKCVVDVKPSSKELQRESEFLNQENVLTAAKPNHRTGPDSRKRSHNTALQDADFFDIDALFFDGLENKDEDEPDYPRKKLARSLSQSNGLLTYGSSRPTLSATSDILDDDEYEQAIIDDDEEDDIEDEEEEAIIRDIEESGDFSTPSTPAQTSENNSSMPYFDDIDFNLIEGQVFDDLDNEAFLAEWNNPAQFADINLAFPTDFDPFADLAGEDLFSVNPSPAYTPVDTPNVTPRGSFSATADIPGSPTPRARRASVISQSSNADEDESEDEDVAEIRLFQNTTPVAKHITGTQSSANKWANDTDEDHEVWKHFFSSGEEETSEEDECEADGEEGSDEETDEGETTEEDEDLPMPTPHEKSMLRRASISSAVGSARPQIVRISDSNDSGPTLGSWVADPSRPICVIDGRKKTFIVPGGEKRLSIAESDSSAFTNGAYVFSESESDFSSAPLGYNPTLTGLTGGEGNLLNGSDILGPPEAFYPFIDRFGAQLDENLFNIDAEDGMDEFEADLQLDDFLDFSHDEDVEKEDGAGGDPARSSGMTFDGVCDDDDEEDQGVKDRESSDAMLSRWEKVSVTAFRRRQLQHNQKMAQSNSQGFGNRTPGAHKNREGRLSETITPGTKRRLKQKFLAGNSQNPSPNIPLRKVATKRVEELGWNTANNKWAPLFEGL